MKTILVPTDFSDCAINALKFAASIAKKTGASINLLHVLEVPELGPQGSKAHTSEDVPYMLNLLKLIKTRMKKMVALPFLKSIKTLHNVEVGNVNDQILAAAKKHKADIIIMGTHGASGFQEVFIGSNAEKIARNSLIPVISVKEEVKESKIDKIIYATDFSEETELIFPEVEKIASLLGSKIEIVKVITMLSFETSSKTLADIKRFKEKFKNGNYTITTYYEWNKQAGIRNFADSVNADMIALGVHGRRGLSDFFNRNIAENLVNHSMLPVLTVNKNRDSFEKNY